ncbi:unnamed protein product [Colias eurytheme]|nr:unnamed protein product [Colias eurytheme]
MTAVKKIKTTSKEKTKRRRISKYLYCLDCVIPNLLSAYKMDYNPHIELTAPTLKNTIANEFTSFLLLEIIDKDALSNYFIGYTYEKSICEQLNNINYIMFAYFQIIASIYLDTFPKSSLQDLDAMMSLYNALLLQYEDLNIEYTIHIFSNLLLAYRMYADNMKSQNQINVLDPDTWALMVSSKYLHFPHSLLVNYLKDFIELYSSNTTTRIIIHFKLYTTDCLNNLVTEKIFSYQNLNWTKEHAKVLEESNLGKYIINTISFEENKEMISDVQFKVPESASIIELYEKESSHEKCNNRATNTANVGGNAKFEDDKKSCGSPFNNSLWIADLCGDSLRTKADFSAYILKCSCFDEVLNLDPSVKYLRNVVEPLKSTIFVKIFLRDLTKTFLNTLFYFPI